MKGKRKTSADGPVEPKRLNRTVKAADALGGVLDAALKKRGFATRDIFIRWADIAPPPYAEGAVPDQLKWPRGAGYEGATLYLRCLPAHRLGLAYEGERIASAINRYFGYFLVREVKLSAEPMERAVAAERPALLETKVPDAVAAAVRDVEDTDLKAALSRLGAAMRERQEK